ncbi:MAG: ABC transporter permease [Armatimonadota bacterium]|nr:ABC transporter permease [Armatimonadota bacterium]
MVELVVEGRKRQPLGQALRELWAFREVVLAFAERDVRVKYKQAVLGVLWVVLQPLSFLLIFSVVFGRLSGIAGGGASYAASTLAALVPWFFLQTAVSFGALALLGDAALLRKIYFPREAPIVGAVLGAGLDFAVGLLLLAALGPWLGTLVSWTVLLVVPLWLLLAALATGAALGLGALTVYYRDFRYVVPLLLQLWMFASPVAYPLGLVPERWQVLYVAANPAAGALEAIRQAVAGGRLPDPSLVLSSALGSAAVLVAGYLLFKSLEPDFADAI